MKTSRIEFVRFLDRLSYGIERLSDWSDFAIEHFSDELLESIRCSLVRLAINRDPKGNPTWNDADREQFRRWAEQLRD